MSPENKPQLKPVRDIAKDFKACKKVYNFFYPASKGFKFVRVGNSTDLDIRIIGTGNKTGVQYNVSVDLIGGSVWLEKCRSEDYVFFEIEKRYNPRKLVELLTSLGYTLP